jgi:hypothetical protein
MKLDKITIEFSNIGDGDFEKTLLWLGSKEIWGQELEMTNKNNNLVEVLLSRGQQKWSHWWKGVLGATVCLVFFSLEWKK